MKNLILICMVLLFVSVSVYSQDYAETDQIKVYTPEGWKIKAKNKVNKYLIYTFSFVTEGTNNLGEVVSSVEETIGPNSLQPYEERDLFTAPQDPDKEIKYTFKSIKMIKVEEVSSNRRRGY